MKRWLAVAGAALWLTASGASAQTVPDPSPRALELATRYVELMQLEQMMAEMMLGSQTLQDETVTGLEALGMPVKGDAAAGEIPTFMPDGSLDALAPMIDLMETVMVLAVAETYPEPELEALVDFFDNDRGRAILGRQAALQTRMTGLMLERMPEMMEAMGMDPSEMMGGMAQPGGMSGSPTRSMSPSTPYYGGGSLRGAVAAEAPVLVISEEDWVAGQAAAGG